MLLNSNALLILTRHTLEEVAAFLDLEEDRTRASQRNLDGKILRVHKLHEDVHSFQRNRILGRSTRDKGEPDLSGLQHAKHNYAAAGSQVFCCPTELVHYG
jgi:hypothetical protein